MITRELLETVSSLLISEEGFRQFAYKDTKGIISVGFGRNLRDTGISRDEARMLLENDIKRVYSELLREIPWICQLEHIRKAVIIDMAYNMGVKELMGFKKFLGYVQRCQWLEAGKEMLNSKWWTDVGRRAVKLRKIIETGSL